MAEALPKPFLSGRPQRARPLTKGKNSLLTNKTMNHRHPR
jgi:hypothetical protein